MENMHYAKDMRIKWQKPAEDEFVEQVGENFH